jgi:hypothetical protein
MFAYAMVIDKYKDPMRVLGDGARRKLCGPASQNPGGSSNFDGERSTSRLCAMYVQALDGPLGAKSTRSYAVLKPGGALASMAKPPDAKLAKSRGVPAHGFFMDLDGQKLEALGISSMKRRCI